MRHHAVLPVVTSLLVASASAWADADLTRKHNCVACHLEDKKKYGPAFKDIAAKYRGDPTAAARLARKVRAGGSGVWGMDAMPPQPGVPKADAAKLVAYILSMD